MIEHDTSHILMPDQPSPKLAIVKKAPLIGCASGGCLFPIILFIFAAVSGDMGGPLFWPIAVIFLGALGTVIGAIYGLIRWSLDSRTFKSDKSNQTKQPNKMLR
jgi:hypothetical protein